MADVCADTHGDVGVGASDDNGENDGTGSSGVDPPQGEIYPRSDSLRRSPRPVGMSILKSRAAV